MLGVSHFSETLLEAVENELTVRAFFSNSEPNLNLLRFAVLDLRINSEERIGLRLHRRTLPPKLLLPCELPISVAGPICSATTQGPQSTRRKLLLARCSLQ